MASIPSVIGILKNMRMHAPQQIDSRRGMTSVGVTNPGLYVHSLRRMNSGASFIRLAAADTNLIELVSEHLFPETFSGNPLSMVPFRPEQSPLPWMYVADSLTMRKISMTLQDYLMGVAPPLNPPTAGPGPQSFQQFYDFNTLPASAWVPGGTGSTMVFTQQANDTRTAFLADQNATAPDFCSISVPSGSVTNYTVGQILQLTTSGVYQNTVIVTGVLNSDVGANLTINSIVYASGTTGPCTVTVTPVTSTPYPNHMIARFSGGEYVQVNGCVKLPSGKFRFQCTTVSNHTSAETLAPQVTVRGYVNVTPNTPFVRSPAMTGTMSVGTATWTVTVTENLLTTLLNGVRPIQTGTPSDSLNLNFLSGNMNNITSVEIQLDVDATQNDFTQNYYSYTWSNPGTVSRWISLTALLSALVRTGSDTSRTLANVAAIRLTVVSTNALTNIGFSSMWVGGNYGPAIGSSTTPYIYRFTARGSATGATSNASPALQSGFSPGGNGMPIAVYCNTQPDPQVDLLDVYRFGGTLLQWTFIGTAQNTSPPSAVFDVFQDAQIASNPVLATDNFQPFPTVDTPKSGVCSVNGTVVTWVSGDQFNVQWAQGTQITINGVLYSLYQQPQSPTQLTITQPAGLLVNPPFQISQATILGVPLPCLWGPFSEGTASFLFACGDLKQPGVLFLTKGNNPDAGPDTLQIEVTSPSEPLMNGCMYDGTSFVWSSDRLFRLYPLFGSTIIVNNGTVSPAEGTNLFTPIEVPNGKGLWARWGLCVGPKIWFIGRDGIYETTGGEPKLITLGDWSKLFPHEGHPGVPIAIPLGFGGPLLPPDTTKPNQWRLAYADGYLYFDYPDANGIPNTLVYDTETETWGVDAYNPFVTLHYAEEGPSVHSILLGTNAAQVFQFSQTGYLDGHNAIVQFGLGYPLMNEGGGMYSTVREALVGFVAETPGIRNLNLNIALDQEQLPSVQLLRTPPVVGGYQRLYTPAPAGKGRLQGWSLIGDGPFTIVMRDCEMHVRKWGAEGPWEKINPFSSQRRAQTPVIG
jgi:hypothetical protein